MDVLENYTGHVDPEGPAARRTLDALTITKISVGPMDNNVFVVRCKATGDAVLVDAGCGGGLLAPHVERLGYRHVGVDIGESAVRKVGFSAL